MAVIGIDVGGHSIKAGIVTKKGTLLKKEVLLTEPEKGRKVVIENIMKIAKRLLAFDRSISSIGIGIPGIVDKAGFVTYTPNIPLSGYHLGRELRRRLRKKIVFGNDADNFALAKFTFGTGKGKATIVALTLGTGVGSGLILNGRPFVNKGAPELGHTTIKYDAPQSKCCHNNGCLESLIGRKSFADGPLITYKKALMGNKEAVRHFQKYGKYLGAGIANFVNAFHPDMVILGGELSNAYDFFRKPMEEEVQKRALFKTRIIRSKMREAGTIGAGILAF